MTGELGFHGPYQGVIVFLYALNKVLCNIEEVDFWMPPAGDQWDYMMNYFCDLVVDINSVYWLVFFGSLIWFMCGVPC